MGILHLTHFAGWPVIRQPRFPLRPIPTPSTLLALREHLRNRRIHPAPLHVTSNGCTILRLLPVCGRCLHRTWSQSYLAERELGSALSPSDCYRAATDDWQHSRRGRGTDLSHFAVCFGERLLARGSLFEPVRDCGQDVVYQVADEVEAADCRRRD